ncbi:MAG: DNA-3-methyladenine glycosylase [Acidobacteriota bacterium]|nr:DNA-3-methyladenine glycosylase [Acidobacteriota bacterium]MDH3522605.1 DNA-3-methyladenine glycosylase [Acidobacteriota bacterium]
MGSFRTLPRSFFRRSAVELAPDLLGRYVVRELAGERLAVRIVETEAYLGAEDRASHAWNGRRTERTRALYRPGGFAYVYFIYGMHHMLNVVAGTSADGSAVLVRAGEPARGVATMLAARGLEGSPRPGDVAGGPGRLCRALTIDRSANGVPLWRGPLRIAHGEPVAPGDVAVGPRVGVGYAGAAAAWPLRFAVRGNPHVSRPRL